MTDRRTLPGSKDTAPSQPGLIDLSRPDGRELTAQYIVPGLHRGLSILALFGRTRPTLSASEIAAMIGLPRSAAFRLIYTLESMGFLHRRGEDDRYELGLPVLDLGFSTLAAMDVVDLAEGPLRRLRDMSGGSAHLAKRDGRDIVYLMRFASADAMTGNVQVGTRLPAHGTTLGRALLMDCDRAALEVIFGKVVELPAYTATTARTLDALHAQLVDDHARGHVIGHSIYENGLDSMAAPIRDSDGRIVAALSIVGFGLIRKSSGSARDLVGLLRNTADEISRSLGAKERV